MRKWYATTLNIGIPVNTFPEKYFGRTLKLNETAHYFNTYYTILLKSLHASLLQDVERGERGGFGVSPSTYSRPASASASRSTPDAALTSAPASQRESIADRYDARATAGGVGRQMSASSDSRGARANTSVNKGSAGRSERSSRWRAVGRVLRRLVLMMLLLAVTAAVLALIVVYMGPIYLVQLLVVVSVAYFVAGGRMRWLYIAFKTLPRDTKWVSFLAFCFSFNTRVI